MKRKALRLAMIAASLAALVTAFSSPVALAEDAPKSIALSIPFASAPFYWAAANGFKDEGERLGYKVIVNNADNSVERQVAHIDNYRVTNVAGAAAIAADADALKPAITQYMAGGHPFFAIDRDIHADVTGLLVTDNVVAGENFLVCMSRRSWPVSPSRRWCCMGQSVSFRSSIASTASSAFLRTIIISHSSGHPTLKSMQARRFQLSKLTFSRIPILTSSTR